jgi:hypothetical protein
LPFPSEIEFSDTGGTVAFTSALARDTRRHDHVPKETAKSTLGDLIVALTEETECYVDDEQEVYRTVAYMVSDLLSRRRFLSGAWH